MTNQELDEQFTIALSKVYIRVEEIYQESKQRWEREDWLRWYCETGDVIYNDHQNNGFVSIDIYPPIIYELRC